MDFTIEFGGGDPQDVTITLSGEADIADIVRCERELTSDPRYRTGLAILCDCSRLQTDGIVHQPTIELAARPVSQRDVDRPARAVAYVAADEEAFADLTIWRAHLGGSKSNRRIFMSRQEALDWLRQPAEGG
jgi:hypothetical protein